MPIGDFPLNDDWVYALAVRSILDTGQFALPSPSSANVFAQAYWGAMFCELFGFSFTVLRISTLVLGAVGVLALFFLLREIGTDRRLAFVAAMSLAVNPLYLGLANTFMTDVPFTALLTTSLWLYARSARLDDRASLWGAILLAFAAVLIRQFALVLLIGFAVASLARKRGGFGSWITALLPIVLGVALHIAYQRWLVGTGRTPMLPLPINLIPQDHFAFLRRSAHAVAKALPYIGLFAAPFLAYRILSRPRQGWSYRKVWSGLLCAGLTISVAAPLVLYHKTLPALGNVLTQVGLGPLTLRDTYLLHINEPAVPAPLALVWAVLTLLGTWLSVVAGGCVWRAGIRAGSSILRPGSRPSAWPQFLLLTFISGYSATALLAGYIADNFDRYLLVLIPPLFTLIALDDPRPQEAPTSLWRLAPCVAIVLVFGAFSVAATHDYLAWNAARWRATDMLLESGVRPRQIDGGYEFNGWLLHDRFYKAKQGTSYWWVIDDEYVIASGPIAGYDQTGEVQVDRWLDVTPSAVITLHRSASRGL